MYQAAKAAFLRRKSFQISHITAGAWKK